MIRLVTAQNQSMAPSLLVVDDEESLRHLLSVILGRAGYTVFTAEDGQAGLDSLIAHPEISIALCDVRMPQLDGLGFLKGLKSIGRPIYTVVMSAYGSMDLALEAMKAGAADYISKPFKADEILLVLRKIEERERLRQENVFLRAALKPSGAMTAFVGASASIKRLLEMATKIADFPSNVLITGESGTGKEVLAKCIHKSSSRKNKPFVAINCAAIPENLLESELFGHARGAFTGAVRAKKGLFESAHLGTILLDEIGDMPLVLQVKLLRVLENQSVRAVGESRERKVDVRVIAATAQDLESGVADGSFREDLYYRLNVVRMTIPPLRDRREDIPLLVSHFLVLQSAKLNRPMPRLSSAVHDLLVASRWPGNVRQLQNAMERAVVLAQGETIQIEDLPDALRVQPVVVRDEELSIKKRLPALEKELITQALASSKGNRSQAARLLEISYKALLYKIRNYDLGDNDSKPS
jgi:two-component system response regulator AtoC